MRAVFLDRDSLDTGDLDFSALERVCGTLQYHAASERDEVCTRIQGAGIVISNKVMLDAETLRQAQELQLICIAATGTNNVDLDAARARGLVVSNCRGYGTQSVAQHAIMLMLTVATSFNAYQRELRAGAWQQARQFCLLDHPIRELGGRVLGIVGYGELGRATAQLAQAFGMQVRIAALPGRPAGEERVPLAELLPQVDVLSLHCPLTAETRGLIGAAELAAMKSDAILINTARGGLVDEAALVAALRRGRLGGAGVDVLSAEPPLAGNPLLVDDLPNLIVTPHNAWGSREARQRLVDQLVENVQAFIAGAPRRVVI